MSQKDNLRIAQEFLGKIGAGASAEEIAGLFSVDLQWDFPGDVGVLPWVKTKSGRGAVSDFVRDTQALMERVRFEVHDILAGEDRAVIVGELATRFKSTGKMVETPFAIVLTVSAGEITRFLMLENSFAVSAAARPQASAVPQ
jgi:ketosteroid isomerase-like protein